MAITRTRKSENQEPMFETPIAQVFEDTDNEDNSKNEDDERYKTLEDKIVEMQKQLAESQQQQMALISQPSQWRSQVEQVTEIKPESIELPDPALDPNGYEAAVAKRQEIRSQNSSRRADNEARRQEDIKTKTENLWSAFEEKFPDFADDKEKIDFAATQVLKTAIGRGVDPERYMFVTQDTFLKDVAAKYVKVFGEPELEDDNFEDNSRRRNRQVDPAPRSRARSRNRQEEDDNRTGGIFGGNESGGRASSSRRGNDDEGPSMIDDLQSLQKRTGFF